MIALMLHSLCFHGRLVAECFWCELKVPVQWLVVFGWFGRLVCILSNRMRKVLQAPSPEEDLCKGCIPTHTCTRVHILSVCALASSFLGSPFSDLHKHLQVCWVKEREKKLPLLWTRSELLSNSLKVKIIKKKLYFLNDYFLWIDFYANALFCFHTCMCMYVFLVSSIYLLLLSKF